MFRKIIAAAAVPVVAAIGLGVLAVAPASARAVTCTAMSAPGSPFDRSYQILIHGDLALDALNWGGGGNAGSACTGAQVNDPIGVYATAHAGGAADFTQVPVPLASLSPAQATACGSLTAVLSRCAELVYTPDGQASSSPLCVSTVTVTQGADALLRGCTNVTEKVVSGLGGVLGFTTGSNGGVNVWQDFALKPVSPGATGSFIEAVLEPGPGPYVLNDAGFGGNGSHVISWVASVSGNQLWHQVTATP
jgi:hypothetical protein